VAVRLLPALDPLLEGDRLLLAFDDTPTARSGPCIEGAGIHHNPTPGPAGEKFVYGHVWVTLAALAKHPDRGTIALPLRNRLYIRRKDLDQLDADRRVPFHTKLELAAEELHWACAWRGRRYQEVWAVVDGGYSKRPFLRQAKQEQVVVVGRLAKNAALWSLPVDPPPGRPGRKPTYGTQRLVLHLRAAHRGGWEQVECVQYRERVSKTVKTFRATWKPAGGLIRVVIVKEEDGWRAYFSTKADASAAEVLEAVADRGGAGGDEQGRQGGVGGGPAAGAQPGGQRGLLQPQRLDVQPGGGVGVGTVRGGAGGPQRQSVGRRLSAAVARGQA
jgi:hypothetical protein